MIYMIVTQAQMASELESLKLEVRWISEKQMQTTGIQGYELDADTEETRGLFADISVSLNSLGR